MVRRKTLFVQDESPDNGAASLASVGVEPGSKKQKKKGKDKEAIEERREFEEDEMRIVEDNKEHLLEERKREERSSHTISKFSGGEDVEAFLVQFKLDELSLQSNQMLALRNRD